MRRLLSLALLLPGTSFACGMPADMVRVEPKMVVDIGPGAQLEALFKSIEAGPPAPAALLGVPAPAAPTTPTADVPTPVAPSTVIPEAQAPAVPQT